LPLDRDDAWSPSLSCRTWSDAHRTAAAMQQGGVLLRTPEPPPIGSGVHLTLRFPDGSDVVLVGDVLDVRDAEGVVVRFRVASPILTQLQSRAQVEQRGEPPLAAPRPARPLARGSTVPDAIETSAEVAPRRESEPGTTYSIHRKKKPTPAR
jgi:hypothetical protein